jgi:hypothetical protein
VSGADDVRPRGPRLRHLGRAADIASNANTAPEKAENVRLANTSHARHDCVMALDKVGIKTLDFRNKDVAA